jgi:GT2 family glycosyltransferase
MNKKYQITSSIVLYKENLNELTKTVNSFLNIPLTKKLYLIDNTPNKSFENIFKNEEVEYISSGKNIGFGNGHNLILKKIKPVSQYHLILNPDVTFDKDVIPSLIKELEKNSDLAMIAPKVLFPNGSHQYSCRKYPTPFSLIARRSKFLKYFFKTLLFNDEYRFKDLTKPFYPEYITGCFQLYKTHDFVKINGFDKRYFLYMEDVDICKKIDAISKKKMYYPQEKIYHILKQGSLKKINLFFRHISSAIKYFLKWGFS